MHPQPKVGDKINHLTIIEINKSGRCVCQCDCGTVTSRFKSHRFWTPQDSKKAHNKTCGKSCPFFKKILREKKLKHGDAPKDQTKRHTFYEMWSRMIERCHNENNPSYPQYGAVGITVALEWRTNYLNFRDECYAFPDPDIYPEIYFNEPELIIKDAKLFYAWYRINYHTEPERIPSASDVHRWGALTGKDKKWFQHWTVDRILNRLPDNSPGCYVSGNTRLLPPSYQSVNRTMTLSYRGKRVVDQARAAGIRPATVRARIKNKDSHPLRQVENPANQAIDAAVAELVKSKKWVVHEDGRIIDTVRNAPIIPYSSRDKEYLIVKVPQSAIKDFPLSTRAIGHHRAVAIAHYGLPTRKRWYVHHINQHKCDNKAENLCWLSGSKHIKRHKSLKALTQNEIEENKSKFIAYYTNRANYVDLMDHYKEANDIKSPFRPVSMLDNEVINDLLANQNIRGLLENSPKALRAIVGAPGNAVEKSPEGLTIRVLSSSSQREVRIPLEKIAKTHYIFWACDDCRYQSDQRAVLRDQFVDRNEKNAIKHQCRWCKSIAVKRPSLAPYVFESEGKGKSPFSIDYKSKKKELFHCRFEFNSINPCTSPPLLRIACKVGEQGPICDNCRVSIRKNNLKSNSRNR